MKLDEEILHHGRILTLARESHRLPNGRVAHFEVARHSGGAAVLPVLEGGDLLLIRQYRAVGGGMILEIPAGRLEPGEDPACCAERELEEETGYRAGRIARLGSTLPSVGYTTERIHLFVADRLTETASAREPDEYIEMVRLPLDEALAMVDDGRIDDAKTQIALTLYARSKGGG